MVNLIPESIKKLWDIWNIRVLVLFSLFLQIVLILLSPNRKRSSYKRLAFTIWICYLLADVIANYAVALISSNQSSKLSGDNRDLLAFWSPFLLVHLGGPDTITALALEDNELWLRHLLALVFQAAATIYVFLQSLPDNKLTIPMVLMFVSGCIKYLERTRSLYLASSDRFFIPDNASVPISLPTLTDDLQWVRLSYRLFRVFKCRFADLIVRPIERDQSWELFHKKSATTALRLIEVELNFIYDILFTKAMVVHSLMGAFCRLFSFCCLIASLAVFRFHITKHGVFNGINVAVTYALFLGAVALELITFLMAVFSDWTVVAMVKSQKSEESPDQNWWRRIVARVSNFVLGFLKTWSYWTPCWYLEEGAQPNDQELRTCLLFRRWSGCLSGHNLIRYCLKVQPSGIHNTESNLCVPIVKAISYAHLDWLIDWFGLRDLLDEMTCLSREPLRKNLWDLIFQQLKEKSKIVYDRDSARQITSAKGEWVLQQSDLNDENLREKLKKYIDASYDESLLLWHVATELLYIDYQDRVHVGTNLEVDPKGYVEMSKTLSDYMMYLLIMQPNIMAPVGGAIGKIRFRDTCTEAKKFFDELSWEHSQQAKACKYILEAKKEANLVTVKDDESKSVLYKASMLAKELQKLEGKKWEFISKVWVELLCHAAGHGRGKAHAQQLSKGGELITFVWLLMDHFGIGKD